MGRRTKQQTLLICLSAWLFPLSLYAQLPKRLERCLPYPTLAEEIAEMRGETQNPVVVIESVELVGATQLPQPLQQQLLSSLKQREFDADSNWLDNLREEVRGAYQDHGYFLAATKAEFQVLGTDATRARISVVIQVEEGPQLWLADLRFANEDPGRGVLVFPPGQLRSVFPITEGEIFNVAKIRQGLEALKQLYGSHGYIDFVASPHRL